MKCNNCGAEVSNDAKFCPQCGSDVSVQSEANARTMYCYNCGKPVDPNIPYCLNCGVKIDGNDSSDSKSNPKSVGFVEAYRLYWKNYFKFSGRSVVSEYWFVVLWNIIIGFVTSMLQNISGYSEWYDAIIENLLLGGGDLPTLTPFAIIVAIVLTLWRWATLIPGLSLTVRRLHDVGKSGWYIFMVLIPLVGWIFLLVALIKRSQPGLNQYDN